MNPVQSTFGPPSRGRIEITPWGTYAAKAGASPSLVEKVWHEAEKQGVSPSLVLSLVANESAWNPQALNAKNENGTNDWGLFQLNSRHHPQFRDNLDKHIEYGVKLIGDYVRRFGTVKGLATYNVGYRDDPPSQKKKQTYVGRVLKQFQRTQSALADYKRFNPSFQITPWTEGELVAMAPKEKTNGQ